MGLLNPLKKVVSKIKDIGGRVTDKLPAPGHTIIGDAIAKRKATKLPMPPRMKSSVPSVTSLMGSSEIRPAGQITLPKGNKFKL